MSIEDRGHALASDLHDAVSLLRRLDHRETVFDRMGHRFFAIDILASGARIHEHLSMLMVRDRNDHGIYIFAVENLFVIARRRHVLFYRFLSGGMSRVIKIAYGDTFNPRHAQRRLQQLTSPHARADGGKPHGVAGRNRPSRSP